MDEFTNMSMGLLRNDSLNGTGVSGPHSNIERMSKIIVMVSGFIVMASLGCTMELTNIKAHILKPKGVGIAIVAQYGIMPTSAFCLAKAFDLSDISAVVVLICGCCPAGNLSNVLSLAFKGDMNLSIVMTTCSTTLALGMMPLLLFIYCQGFEGLQQAVPYRDIVFSLLSILIPCAIGILINHYRPKYSDIISKAGLSISITCLALAIVLTIINEEEKILSIIAPPLLAIAFLLPMIGFFLGYIFSSFFRLPQAERRTVMMETGCQNGKLCITLIKMAFPPAVAETLFLYPLVLIFTQLFEALLLLLVFRAYECWLPRRNKVRYRPGNPELQ